MSFIVRHKKTGCYLCGQDDWTDRKEGALQFTSGLLLIDYLEHGGVHEKPEIVEIVVCPNAPATAQSHIRDTARA